MSEKKNNVIGLYRNDNGFIRVLDESEGRLLVIRSDSKAMPLWADKNELEGCTACSEEELEVTPYEELSQAERLIVHKRFTMIAPVLFSIGNIKERKRIVRLIADGSGVSQQTVKSYICTYLLFNDIAALAPKRRNFNRELTQDEKNFRWALNQWYYSWMRQTLTATYENMLKEKYCDDNGMLLPEYPTMSQFRYFFEKTRSFRKEVISREGIKVYQRNYRPLVGDGVQKHFPMVGYGMLDATICDIYLVDDAGQVIGRPIMVACVDAFSGLCCGYSLLWEGGVYSLRNLLLNTITSKVEWCLRYGIEITSSEWPCHSLPAMLLTDMGSEFTSGTFEQITELGVELTNLSAYRPDLKGPVEKLFDIIQTSYKKFLKGKGVIEPDFQERGAHDYRKDACLTMEDFEKVILHCIIFYNTKQVLENFPYTKEMVDAQVKPNSSSIWNWCVGNGKSNLIPVTEKELLLTLLPRTSGRFTRYGLQTNRMRYHCEGFTDRYLEGGNVTVAYNPDDVSKVWLLEDGAYTEFHLIESRYKDKSLSEVEALLNDKNQIIRNEAGTLLQAKVDLARHIEAIAAERSAGDGAGVKDIRTTRQKARQERHDDMKKYL